MSITSATKSIPSSTSKRARPVTPAELLVVGSVALSRINESLGHPRGVAGWFPADCRDTFVAGCRGDCALYSIFVVGVAYGDSLAFGFTSPDHMKTRRLSGPYEHRNAHELSWLRLYRAMPAQARQECVYHFSPRDAMLIAAVGGAPAAIIDVTVLVGILWLDHADVDIVRDDDKVCEIKMRGRTLRITISKDHVRDRTVAILSRRTSPQAGMLWGRQALDYKSYADYGHSYDHGGPDTADFSQEPPTSAALTNKLAAMGTVVDRQDGGLCSEEFWNYSMDQLYDAFKRLGEVGRYHKHQAISTMGMQLCREACIRTARSPSALYWKVVAALEREQRKSATGICDQVRSDVYAPMVEILVRLEYVFEVSVVPRNLVPQGVEEMAFVGGLSLK